MAASKAHHCANTNVGSNWALRIGKDNYLDMRQMYFAILTLSLLSCDRKSIENSKQDNLTNTAQIQSETKFTYPENFNNFLTRFNSDSTFQLSRIKFPIEQAIKDPHEGNDASIIYKDKHDWVMYINLEYRTEYHDNVELEIKQDTIWNQREILIQQRGGYVDSHIIWDVDYKFAIIDGKWFLVTMKDFTYM